MSAANTSKTNTVRKTGEERAEIRRQNGAKSKGPISQMGKDRSRLNSLKHCRHVSIPELMVPPHSSVLFNEDRRGFFILLQELQSHFRVTTEIEMEIVRDMADARWNCNRAKALATSIQNRALYTQTANHTADAEPDLADVEIAIIAAETVADNKALREARRQVIQYTRLFATLAKTLADLRKHFPNSVHKPLDHSPEIERELLIGPTGDDDAYNDDAVADDSDAHAPQPAQIAMDAEPQPELVAPTEPESQQPPAAAQRQQWQPFQRQPGVTAPENNRNEPADLVENKEK